MKSNRESSSLNPLVRVFCAVELSNEARKRAAEHTARLKASVPDARASWVREENLHLTLKFLGEIEEGRVDNLSRAAARAGKLTKAFKLAIEGAGSFPPRGIPRVLWLGVVDSTEGLGQLQRHLEEECSVEGFKREERPFHPHLTLARLRSPQGARTLAELHREAGFEAIEFPITELVVMRSELGAGGSRYTSISRHNLNA
ncbi:MAG TPA: RNA 2',3'-cyclic phosphodiesterase [Pyrinomonadaceae bacterium]